MREPIEVLVVDPHAALRSSLVAMLELEDGIRVAGAAGDMFAARRLVSRAPVAVVLVDTRRADLTSLTHVHELAVLARRVPVVVMGMGSPELYTAAYEAAGASGYWAKYEDVDELVELLRRTASDQPLGRAWRRVRP